MKANRLTVVVLITAALALVVSMISCSQERNSGDTLGIVVTIAPQAEFVENVGGDRVEVTVMVKSGESLHTYEPTPGQMIALSRAEMYVRVGADVEFELTWMDKIIEQNEDMLVVDCSEGVRLLQMEDGNHDGDDQGDGAIDPHIWLSPLNAKIMVQNICDGLVNIDPEGKTYYEKNRDTYLERLIALDRDIVNGLAGLTNRTFMVYHPSFGYFADAYDLTMISIEVEGKEPTASGIARLIDRARTLNIKVIFASPQFNPQSAEVIAKEIGGKVVYVDPLAGDYIANLRSFLGELVQAME